MELDQEKILHMKEGDGYHSYANNSLLQETIMKKARPVIEEIIKELYLAIQPKCLMVVDMGCSSGPNALLLILAIMDIIDGVCRVSNQRQTPSLGVFLNDLPGNDFNNLFRMFPGFFKQVQQEKGSDFDSCFVSGLPKSFYERVFPDKFIHFVHASASVHWLSQVPKGLKSEKGEALNKGNIYISKTSPPEVANAYYAQFKRDFTQFLRLRAKEMVPGGRMVLTLVGSIKSDDPDSIYELLGSTLHDMVLEGKVDEETLDNFNVPYYAPTMDEVKQLIDDIQESVSLTLNKAETFIVDWSIDPTQDLDERATVVTKSIRAISEPILATSFGFDEAILNDLFLRFKTRVKQRILIQSGHYLNILVSMTKQA